MNKYVLITGACINTGVSIVEKFATEGYDVVFTGRNEESVKKAESQYREKFPNVNIKGYMLRSLTEEQMVDEKGVVQLFEKLDAADIEIDTLYYDIPTVKQMPKEEKYITTLNNAVNSQYFYIE